MFKVKNINSLQANSFYGASYRGYDLAVLVLSEESFIDGDFMEVFKAYLLFDLSPTSGFLMFEMFCSDMDLKLGECFGGYADIVKRYEKFFKDWLNEDIETFKTSSMLYRVQLAVLTAGSKKNNRIAAQFNLDKIRNSLLEEGNRLREGLPLL